MNDEIIINKLSELIKDASSIKKTTVSGSIISHFTDRQAEKKFQISADNIIRLRFGENSKFYKDFLNTYQLQLYPGEKDGYYHYRLIIIQTGVLEAILDALKNGLTEDLFYQRELLVFSDLLEQSFELLEHGLNLAAGTYGRVILETTIKEFAKEHGLESKLKFNDIIINLRMKGFIQKPFENSLRANYEIGSWAAHGNAEFNKLNKNEIKEFLVFIRDKVLTLK
jgi:hypothetical protein